MSRVVRLVAPLIQPEEEDIDTLIDVGELRGLAAIDTENVDAQLKRELSA